MDDQFKKLIDYARGGAPKIDVHGSAVGMPPPPLDNSLFERPTATVTPLQPKSEPTLQDEILEALNTLAADIRSGKVLPSHLIIGWGTSTRYGDEDATSYIFDSFGLNRWETIGHLHAYASRLAIGGDVE